MMGSSQGHRSKKPVWVIGFTVYLQWHCNARVAFIVLVKWQFLIRTISLCLLPPPRRLCFIWHLSVCLLATWCKNCHICGQEKNLLNFRIIRIWMQIKEFFEGFCILQHCETGHFSTIWLMSLDNWWGFSGKFYHRCIFRQGSPQ